MPVGGWVDHAVMGHHPMDISGKAHEPEKDEEHAGEQAAAPEGGGGDRSPAPKRGGGGDQASSSEPAPKRAKGPAGSRSRSSSVARSEGEAPRQKQGTLEDLARGMRRAPRRPGPALPPARPSGDLAVPPPQQCQPVSQALPALPHPFARRWALTVWFPGVLPGHGGTVAPCGGEPFPCTLA